jgi:predicted enzyme related to lactoylglutathione lyase
MKNVTTWFEIPVHDMKRARGFYEATLRTNLKYEEGDARPMAIFPADDRLAATGCLVSDPKMKPSTEGCLVYLDAGKDLDGCVARAQQAGGKVLLPRTDIGDPGFIAILLDTEGNRVGLHQER